MSLQLVVNGVDLVAEHIVLPGDVRDSDCEHGLESCDWAQAGQPFFPSANIKVGDAVKVLRETAGTTFEGKVVNLNIGQNPHVVQCAGKYNDLSLRNDYTEAFVIGDSSLWQEVNPAVVPAVYPATVRKKVEYINVETAGEVKITVPQETPYAVGQGICVGFNPLAPDTTSLISKIVLDWTNGVSGTDWSFELCLCSVAGGIWTVQQVIGGGVWNGQGSSHYEYPVAVGAYGSALLIVMWATAANSTGAGTEIFAQLRNLRVYYAGSPTTKPTDIIRSIAMADSTLATVADIPVALGSAVSEFYTPPYSTRAAAIEAARALYTGIMDIAIWQDATLTVRQRPTVPSDRSRWYDLRLSDLATPESGWGIALDSEADIDAVCVAYGLAGSGSSDPIDGSPMVTYYPVGFVGTASSRVAYYGIERASTAEANSAAYQAYTYYHNRATGSVPLDAQHLMAINDGQPAIRNVDGALVNIDAIRSWDWVQCSEADADNRGPFMISRVERTGAGVTIEVGGFYWQAPGFVHPAESKGQYVPGHYTVKHGKVTDHKRIHFGKHGKGFTPMPTWYIPHTQDKWTWKEGHYEPQAYSR